MSRCYRFSLAAVACLAAVAAVVSAYVADFFTSIGSAAIDRFDFGYDGGPSFYDFGPTTIDRALGQSLRHEAGIPRISSARGI